MSLPNFNVFQAIEPILIAQGFSPTEVLLAGATAPSSITENAANEIALLHRRVVVRPDGTVDPSETVAEDQAHRSGGRVLVWCGPEDLASLAGMTQALDVDALAIPTPDDGWRTTSALFDLGFVRIGTADVEGRGVTGYLCSDRVRFPLQLFGQTRGVAAMSQLGSNGRFANQLFQYAFLRLYALRHELDVATPGWDGCDLFGISDPEPDPTKLTPLHFFAFDDDDLALWSSEAPPIDVDFNGYFQELPNCWIHHREFLRRLFRPKVDPAVGLDTWLTELTDGGRRSLAAIHVRRGDYPDLFAQGLHWYRPIPLDWYRNWLERLTASVGDLVIYIATDAPGEVLDAFRAFNPVTAADCPELGIPLHIIDFEIMRRADRLAAANSSFSRMSALLAQNSQEVSIPDIGSEAFRPWDAWTMHPFWDMFASEDADKRGFGSSSVAVRHRSLTLRRALSEIEAEKAMLLRTIQAYKDQNAHAAASSSDLLANIAILKGWIDEKQGYIDYLVLQVAARDERLREQTIIDFERHRTLASTRVAMIEALAARNDALTHVSARYTEIQGLHQQVETLRSNAEEAKDERDRLHEALQASVNEGEAFKQEHDRLHEALQASVNEGEAFKQEHHRLHEALQASVNEGEAFKQEHDRLHEVLQASVNEGKALKQEHHRLRDALQAVIIEREAASTARDEAVHAVRTALFFGSPRGLAQRLAFRPLLHVLSASSRISSAVGLSRLSGKLRHDADILRDRRYREWSGLLRRRLAHAARLGQPRREAPSGLVIGDLPTARGAASALPAVERSAAMRMERGSELRRIAEESPGFVDASRPGIVVVVPWLMQGGSEVVLLDVLQAVSVFMNISLITTLEARHTNADLFKPFAREIHHLEGDLQQDEAADFLVTLYRTRQACLLFSSNADLIYRKAGQLKAANPNLTIIDLLHNDLHNGHFASAASAAPSIDRQVVVGSHIAVALEKRGSAASRIVTIPNGIDTDSNFNPRLTTPRDGRRFFNLKKGGFVLGFVGRMSAEKRPLAFLDIVESLADQVDLRILMVGSGPLDAEIESRLDRIKHPVVWRRHLDRSDMAFVYAALDLLIVPSTIEGMPLAVIEAMAMRVPVAATDVGNIKQIVDHGSNGFIVAVDRYMDLALCVTDLAREPRRRNAMGQAARQAIIARGLTRSAMLDRYRRLFQEATGTDI